MALRLAVVSAYPPNRRPLSEYVWHLVERLGRNPRVEHVHVLADRGAHAAPASSGRVSVHQCWSFGGVDQPFSVVRWARAFAVDAVWFHLHMTSGGNTRLSQFAGLAAPAVSRAAGFSTIVTLHNMLGVTDLKWARPSASRFDVLGGHLATALLRVADETCVLSAGIRGAHAFALRDPGAPHAARHSRHAGTVARAARGRGGTPAGIRPVRELQASGDRRRRCPRAGGRRHRRQADYRRERFTSESRLSGRPSTTVPISTI